MAQWFKATYTYQQVIDDSTVGTKNYEFAKKKVISETILINAVSHTEAEARAYEQAGTLPEFLITGIVPYKLADIIVDLVDNDIKDHWYEMKIDYLIQDEKSSKMKVSKSKMLVNASSAKEAIQLTEERTKSDLDPSEITHVSKTKIIDLLPFNASPDSNLAVTLIVDGEEVDAITQ